jgi:hypothetical protein
MMDSGCEFVVFIVTLEREGGVPWAYALGLMQDIGHGQRQPLSGLKQTAKRLLWRTYGQSIRRKTEIFNWNHQLSKLRIIGRLIV